MKLKLDIELEMDEEQLRAMACVANRGPTNRTLPTEAIVTFWARFLISAIEGGKDRNLAYAALTQDERDAFEKTFDSPHFQNNVNENQSPERN